MEPAVKSLPKTRSPDSPYRQLKTQIRHKDIHNLFQMWHRRVKRTPTASEIANLLIGNCY
jgi:hypothetical protein